LNLFSRKFHPKTAPAEESLLLVQLLDGISGAVIGVLTALVIADLTDGTGRFNLSQGLVGTASGIGASLSTAVFGLIAASFGRTVVFLSIASVALLAVLIAWLAMPETRPLITHRSPALAPVL
jgi:MFS family permease